MISTWFSIISLTPQVMVRILPVAKYRLTSEILWVQSQAPAITKYCNKVSYMNFLASQSP